MAKRIKTELSINKYFPIKREMKFPIMNYKCKVGVFGDLHLTNTLPYTHFFSGQEIRKQSLRKFIKEVFNEFSKEKVDLILTAGDVCHKTALVDDDLELLDEFISESRVSKIPNVVISGNHDHDGNRNILKFLAQKNNDPIHYFSDLGGIFSFETRHEKICVNAINHCSDGEFLELAEEKLPVDHVKILLAHIGIKGTLHGTTKSIHGIKQEDIERISSLYDLMIFGHHHNFQIVCHNGFYVGAIQQTRIDEIDTSPGALIITLDNKINIRRIENTLSPRFALIKDYKIVPSEIKGNIVKPIIDTEKVSEKENRSFVDSIMKCDPYFLIKPNFKKVIIPAPITRKKNESKEQVLKKVIKKMSGEKYEDYILNFYKEVSGGKHG